MTAKTEKTTTQEETETPNPLDVNAVRAPWPWYVEQGFDCLKGNNEVKYPKKADKNHFVREGDEGEHVVWIQGRLNASGRARRVEVTGVFDTNTTQAVVRYQTVMQLVPGNGLPATGVVDKATIDSLASV